MLVRWKVGPKLAMNASRLLLGSCYTSAFLPLPEGGGEAVFHYKFNECRFKELVSLITMSFPINILQYSRLMMIFLYMILDY